MINKLRYLLTDSSRKKITIKMMSIPSRRVTLLRPFRGTLKEKVTADIW